MEAPRPNKDYEYNSSLTGSFPRWSGEDLKAWRKRHDLSQKAAASALGYATRTAITQIEGDRSRMSVRATLVAIALDQIDNEKTPMPEDGLWWAFL